MSANIRPDYHFLLIAPNLGAEWLFDAARVYWDTFRPTIIPDFDLLIFVPPERTVTVTVVARRDTAAQIGVEMSQLRPDAFYDPVIYDMFEEAREELNRRAETQQPFGVALSTPMITPDPNSPSIPTPRLSNTRAPAGFMTATPAPTNSGVTATPGAPEPSTQTTELPPETTLEPTADGATRAPITPPVGPITGG